MNYLEPTDEGAFEDFPRKDPLPAAELGMVHECPRCNGRGGWNLRLNAYPLHGKENTPENRHNFSHFRACCDTCFGYGYVTPENENHIHKWKLIRNLGRCLNLYECECGQKWEVDSSD